MILQIFITYIFYNIIEYTFHYLGHIRNKYNYIYKLHITHHKDYYPITNLLSTKFKGNNEGIIAYSPPTILLILILYNILNYKLFIQVLIQLTIQTGINEYIHTQIHTRDSHLEKYKWFLELRRLHFIHHNKLNFNYSFGIDYNMDKLNNTYKYI